MHLTRFDAESFHEKEIGRYVENELRLLGAEVTLDVREEYLQEHPDSCPNIYAFFPGNVIGEPVLFSAHLDTVSPGNGKAAILHEDGKITSKGDTVLGADDISGIAAILEALRVIKENDLPHPDIEVLITAAEEPFCEGSRHFDFKRIRSKMGYVLDHTGPIGSAALQAPSIISFEVHLQGKAAHAGFAPEKGVNALRMAVKAMQSIRLGRVDAESTVNIGTIRGGSGNNIVPESISLSGEVRSYDHEKAKAHLKEIFAQFEMSAKEAGGEVNCTFTEHIRSYLVKEDARCVARFQAAAGKAGIKETELLKTFGGSDGNRLNEMGIETIVLACGMEQVHTTQEYTTVKALKQSAGVVLALMTEPF